MKNRDDKALREFKDEIARVFNANGLWSCEFCFWLDVDDRICKICHMISEALKEVIEKVYVLEVCDSKKNVRHIAIAESIIAESDFDECGFLTERGKIKYGLSPSDTAEVVGLETFDVNIDTKALVITAVDSCGIKWRYKSHRYRWDEIKQKGERV